MIRSLMLPLLALSQVPCSAQPLTFDEGDRVLLYGNSFVGRLQESGEFEATLQLANPGKQLEFRSLAWTGDEVGYRLRPERYTNHLKKLLEAWPADVVLLGGFGWFEAFAGQRGLGVFKVDLRNYLDEMMRRHPDAEINLMLPSDETRECSGARLAKPPPALAEYVLAMRAIAGAAGVRVIDSQNAAQHLAGSSGDAARVREVAKAVAQKAAHVSTLVRPINTVVYFGVRGRADEYNAEMPRYHQLISQSDAVIHGLVADATKKFGDFPRPALPPMNPREPRGGEKEGIIKPTAEQRKEMRVADGYALNLFASEERFPDLKNPLQIAFGPRGRLWVVTMPSFPHTVPGEQPKDKILILEDTDRDGTADQQTVFADGLNVPDGLVFYKDGIIVSAQPRHLYLWDSDGDGRADGERELLRGVDVTDAHHGGMIAMDPLGHVIFCDGVFHRSQFETPFGIVRGIDATTYRFDTETGRISKEYQTLTPNPWKITFDRWGNLFQMYGDGFVQDSQTIPWTPLGIYHPFKRSISIAYGKGSGAAVISSPNFPDDYQQGMASATLLGRSFVALSKLDPHTGFHQASDRIDLVASDNLAFRPVDMAFGFDGAMYISDFCSTIVGHAQHPMRDPRWDHQHGRIWRVVHTGKPLVREWPDVANSDALIDLLAYPQDNVRDLARVQLRNAIDLITVLDSHLAGLPGLPDEQKLEFLWLFESKHVTRPELLRELLAAADFRIRAAATRLIRFQANRLENAFDILAKQASDPHPRVRIEVINAVSHLQQGDAKWAALLGTIDAGGYQPVETMLADASYGTTPAKGPEVPVLSVPKDSQLQHWLAATDEFLSVGGKGKRDIKEAIVRTYVHSHTEQPAVLSLSHKHVRVSVNGVQLIDANTWWSSDWNLQVHLKEGLNEIEIDFKGGSRAQGIAPAYLFSPTGTTLSEVTLPATKEALQGAAQDYAKANGVGSDTIRISAVPNQLAFTPKELRLHRGQKVTVVFDNPDVQIHNVVITKPGAIDRVGLLADQLALDPKAAERAYVPDSDDVLWSSPLANGNTTLELGLTAPSEPGRYPILCTFPGHWRVMRAVLIVE